MDDLLFQTTLWTARRLLKSRLRLHLGRLLMAEELENNWSSVLTLEEGVEEEATQAWQNVRGRWASSSTSKAMLEYAAKLAYREAKREVVSLFQSEVDAKWLKEAIKSYRPALE